MNLKVSVLLLAALLAVATACNKHKKVQEPIQVEPDLVCPVTWYYEWSNGRKGSIDLKLQVDESWPLDVWVMKLTFDQDINVIHGYRGLNARCSGRVCTIINEKWHSIEKNDTMMSLGFDITFNQVGRDRVYPELVSIQVASTELL